MDGFAARALDGIDPAPVQTREIVGAPQCATIDAVQQMAGYPAGRIGLAVENVSLRSGDTLQGRVLGAGGCS
ncbi:hypothetical protein KDD17_17390 [Sulfitobacter albidus]|uniref:Uncharacterized protein n=1 Tax=Sulfitobacter albidus TaxID=2829501 RepID=A0A975JH13_9RHOB|nr:hypothetical protein [Sulfitobacter albidus]QUJ78115.1 hypothetical protein KDD17_17390 [Sulfitobacter albidus]